MTPIGISTQIFILTIVAVVGFKISYGRIMASIAFIITILCILFDIMPVE